MSPVTGCALSFSQQSRTRGGEASGELDSMLERTATMQENTLQSKIAAIVGLFEPMMLLLMGMVVLIIVLAIMLPILNMSNLVG